MVDDVITYKNNLDLYLPFNFAKCATSIISLYPHTCEDSKAGIIPILQIRELKRSNVKVSCLRSKTGPDVVTRNRIASLPVLCFSPTRT